MHKLLFCLTLSAVMAAGSGSMAASAETDGFVANVRLNATFLARSSDLALDRSENTGLRAFAGKEAAAQIAVIDAVDMRNAPEVASAMPVTVASNEVMTGRSAAIDVPSTPAYSAPAGTGALMPAAILTLAHLEASKGQAFDTLFKATQVNALRQLAGLYEAYSLTGDDPALRQMARTELGATNGRIADISRL